MIFLGKGIPLEKQLWFQDSYTQLATLIVNVHNIIWYFATFIAIYVAWILATIVIDGYMGCNKLGYTFTKVKMNKFLYFSLPISFNAYSSLWDLFLQQVYSVRSLIFKNVFLYTNLGSFPLFRDICKAYVYISIILSSIYDELARLFASSIFSNYKYSYQLNAIESSLRFKHGDLLEFLWLIGPCLILIMIALPSFCILQALKADYVVLATIKVIGNQWYWSYESWEQIAIVPFPNYGIINMELPLLLTAEFCDIDVCHTWVLPLLFSSGAICDYLMVYDFFHNKIILWSDSYILPFDSYMLNESDLDFGSYRLLEVDYPLDVQVKRTYECYITSHDVLHSWAIPSLGIKVDAVPGRLNAIYMFILQPGIYYGQCSELCGVNHGFMPIAVRARIIFG